jgi:hypothetical protein
VLLPPTCGSGQQRNEADKVVAKNDEVLSSQSCWQTSVTYRSAQERNFHTRVCRCVFYRESKSGRDVAAWECDLRGCFSCSLCGSFPVNRRNLLRSRMNLRRFWSAATLYVVEKIVVVRMEAGHCDLLRNHTSTWKSGNHRFSVAGCLAFSASAVVTWKRPACLTVVMVPASCQTPLASRNG